MSSYVTAQSDMRLRLDDLLAERDDGAWGNRWTKWDIAFQDVVSRGVQALLVGGALMRRVCCI